MDTPSFPNEHLLAFFQASERAPAPHLTFPLAVVRTPASEPGRLVFAGFFAAIMLDGALLAFDGHGSPACPPAVKPLRRVLELHNRLFEQRYPSVPDFSRVLIIDDGHGGALYFADADEVWAHDAHGPIALSEFLANRYASR